MLFDLHLLANRRIFSITVHFCNNSLDEIFYFYLYETFYEFIPNLLLYSV